jgi:hypothetical protein
MRGIARRWARRQSWSKRGQGFPETNEGRVGRDYGVMMRDSEVEVPDTADGVTHAAESLVLLSNAK